MQNTRFRFAYVKVIARFLFLFIFLSLISTNLTSRAAPETPDPPPPATPEDGPDAEELETDPSFPVPLPGNLPPEVEEARVRAEMEAVLAKYLEGLEPNGQASLDEVRIDGEWAYGIVNWDQESSIPSASSMYMLAHQSQNGLWQALLPDIEGLYLQWLNDIPDYLLLPTLKGQMQIFLLNESQNNQYQQSQFVERDDLVSFQTTVRMLPGTVVVDDGLTYAVQNTLSNALDMIPLTDYYAITDIETVGMQIFVSVIGLNGISSDLDWNLLDHGAWFGLLLLSRRHMDWSCGRYRSIFQGFVFNTRR